MAELKETIDNKDILRKDGFYITETVKGTTFTSDDGVEVPIDEKCGVFFVARHPCEVMKVKVAYTGASGTLNIERLSGIEALDAGDEILATDLTLSGDNTVSLERTQLQNRILKEDERLAIKDSGWANSQYVHVTIYLKYSARGDYR